MDRDYVRSELEAMLEYANLTVGGQETIKAAIGLIDADEEREDMRELIGSCAELFDQLKRELKEWKKRNEKEKAKILEMEDIRDGVYPDVVWREQRAGGEILPFEIIGIGKMEEEDGIRDIIQFSDGGADYVFLYGKRYRLWDRKPDHDELTTAEAWRKEADEEDGGGENG